MDTTVPTSPRSVVDDDSFGNDNPQSNNIEMDPGMNYEPDEKNLDNAEEMPSSSQDNLHEGGYFIWQFVMIGFGAQSNS